MTPAYSHLRPIFLSLAGFALWVVADSCMKLAGEANLPPHEVVAFLGLFAALSLVLFYAPQGKFKQLLPQKPVKQIPRALMAFGCVMANAVALKHLPLTIFYIMVFTSPMIIVIMAAIWLNERLNVAKVLAVIVGFVGVVIAVDPWNSSGGGDWIGYVAVSFSALFYAIATVILRAQSQTESPLSIIFATAVIEAILGFSVMLLHAVPVPFAVLGILAVMGAVNIAGNLCNATALKFTTAATVEQFHYSQIIFGALIGFFVWHETPSLSAFIGVAIIIATGLYVATSAHQDHKRSVSSGD